MGCDGFSPLELLQVSLDEDLAERWDQTSGWFELGYHTHKFTDEEIARLVYPADVRIRFLLEEQPADFDSYQDTYTYRVEWERVN